MTDIDIRKLLDELIETTTEETFNINEVPHTLLLNLNKWHWGSYGWISPASLIFTATWRKYLFPNEDCCKIWALDENHNPIEGGYSIRSCDEQITIPILAKHDLCTGYCSPNSGMQGSRAIEKMRSLKRLNTDFEKSQKTVFDLKLFATILNQIDCLDSEQALKTLQYQIIIAKRIRSERIKTNEVLQHGNSASFNLLDFLSKTADPELTKCVVAACFDVIYSNSGLILDGVSDYKTAADARAKKPGDLSLRKDNNTLIAIEVKDKTQTIDWNNIDRAKKIIKANPNLINFIFVLEKRDATVTDTIQEMIRSPQFQSEPCRIITFISVHDLFLLALSSCNEITIINRTSYYLSLAPAVKPETKKAWLQETSLL